MARVLVVDDEPAVREMVSDALADEGHETHQAVNGIEALAAARMWQPDVIVLDLMMPAMNGWQFAEAYYQEPGARAAIVAITAAGPGAIRAAEGLGVIASVLAKPLKLDELTGVVAELASASAAGI